MTQYMLSVFDDERPEELPADVLEKIYADVDALNNEIREAGAWVFAGGLHPADTATVVREKNGETVVTDGPYAETKEQVGGFWVIEAPDLDAARRHGRTRPPWPARARSRCAPSRTSPKPEGLAALESAAIDRTFREESGKAIATLIRHLATSTSPKRRFRKHSWWQPRGGRRRVCPQTREAGSSPRLEIVPSTS